ncbi:hypothetical protein SAMN02745978_00266 [Butyricicoccus pullicaecorum DSM 23266]|nr:hypothetical protein SAMN02745978_00266 [Butyricicoccus pullicaecorum DSM 23266]
MQVVFAQQSRQDLNPAGFHIQNTVVFSSPVTRTTFFITSLFECVVQVVFAQQSRQDLNPAGFHIQNTVVF